MKHIFFFPALLLALLTQHGHAQQLIANINKTNAGSSPTQLMGNDNYGAFFARPDGGAYQLFYLPSGADSLLRFETDLPLDESDIIWDNRLIGDDVYFRIFDFDQSEQIILRADLAADSLHTVAELGTSGSSSGINQFTQFDGTNEVLFIHRNQSATFQLFRTDGTVAGTQLVSNLPDNEFVSRIVSQDGFAYLIYPGDFFANQPAYLYLSDGTSTGPVPLPMATDFALEVRTLPDQVLLSGFGPDSIAHLLATPDLSQFRNLSSFPNDSNTSFLRVAFLSDTEVYYTRSGEDYSHELLRTDTSATNLDTIIELNPTLDTLSFFDHSYDPGSGLLYYLGRDLNDGKVSLFRSDLTTGGTFELTVVQPAGASITNIASKNRLSGGLFYFLAYRDSSGEELWVSDGTVSGTGPVLDLVPGMDDARIEELTRVGDRLGFRANSVDLGEEVFISDGSTAGTRILSDINEKESGSFPGRFFALQDSLFFIATNGCNGFELYKSGGTGASTQLVKDLIPGRAGYTQSVQKTMTVANRAYYLISLEGVLNSKLVESDGTTAGTREIFTSIESLGISGISPPGQLGNDLLISAFSIHSGQQLYRYDPTTMQIDTLAFLSSSGVNSSARCFYSLSDSVSLFSPYINTGPRLYRSDGTAQGTYLIPLMGLPDPFSISGFNLIDGQAYFIASANVFQDYIFQTDGTQAGTQRLNTTPYERIHEIFTYQGEAYFFADQASTTHLYRIDPMDGTISQTGLLNGTTEFPSNTIVKGDTIFFTAISDAHGEEVWMIAGISQPATQIVDLRMGTASSFPRELTMLGDLLYFTAEGDSGRRDLYISDGSAQGTVPVRSLSGSKTAFSPSSLFVHDSLLYYSAFDAELNQELFRYNPAAPFDTSSLDDPGQNIHCDPDDGTVSIGNQELERAISLYPNPTADRLTVSIAENHQVLEVSLFSADGQLIGKQEMNGNFLELSLGGLPPGVYILSLFDPEKEEKVVRRIVKY